MPRDTKTRLSPPPEAESEPDFASPTVSRRAERITVLIADDHAIVREGLVSVINRSAGLELVAEARNGREALELYEAKRPDIALLDLRMPGLDGIEAMKLILQNFPAARVIILTTYETEEDIYRALQSGAAGYFLKESPSADVIDCIRRVASGEAWIPPEVGAKLAKRVSVRGLTAREGEVLKAVAIGKSNKEIGVALNISESTVKVHMTHILEKLKVTGRTEAINAAIRRGLVKIGDQAA